MTKTVRDTPLTRAGNPVQVSVASICADGFGDEDYVPFLDIMPRTGVKTVELMCWHPRNVTRSGLARNRQRLLNLGLNPGSIHFLAFNGSDIHETTQVAHFLWMLEACKILGVSVLKFTGANRNVPNGLKKAISVLRHVTPAAEEMGISLIVENHFDNTFEFKHDYEEIFASIDSPNVGMCLDTGHFLASDVDMIDLITSMPDKIFQIDMKDCSAPGGRNFVRFGQGAVDFDRVIDTAKQNGFSGYLLVEFPRADVATAEADIMTGIEIAARHASAARPVDA